MSTLSEYRQRTKHLTELFTKVRTVEVAVEELRRKAIDVSHDGSFDVDYIQEVTGELERLEAERELALSEFRRAQLET